jgi:putative transposase
VEGISATCSGHIFKTEIGAGDSFNHIHLLVFDRGEREVIPRSMQLIAGRPGQEFNQRKKRKGAFWEDRYHATAVEANRHLIQCLVYMDLNMVRAGSSPSP